MAAKRIVVFVSLAVVAAAVVLTIQSISGDEPSSRSPPPVQAEAPALPVAAPPAPAAPAPVAVPPAPAPVSRATPAKPSARVRPAAPQAGPVVAAAPAPPAPAATSKSRVDHIQDLLEGKPPAKSTRVVPGNYDLSTIEGYAAVHLGAGAPTTFPLGPSDEPVQTITGRVIDRAGNPVANAIVLADTGFGIRRGDILANAGVVTDERGEFTIANAPKGPCLALALVRQEWSEVVAVTGARVELRMIGHGSLAGRFTYNGGGDTFEVRVAMQGKLFSGVFTSGSNGRIVIPSLPPGRYAVTVGLAQEFLGGESRTLTREVTITDGTTTELALGFGGGTTVVLKAKPPADSNPKGITYWLFSGSAPRDGVDATARDKSENAPSMMVGGSSTHDPAQFHDIPPGTYFACAGLFDRATMGAFARPFGCRKITVEDSDSVAEIEIVLVN
jgi:hypothetical protein